MTTEASSDRRADIICAGPQPLARSELAQVLLAVLDRHQSDLVRQAVRGDRIAVRRHVHVAHDVTAARNRPGLEFFSSRLETDDGVRLGAGLVVPERAFGEDDAVGLRFW